MQINKENAHDDAAESISHSNNSANPTNDPMRPRSFSRSTLANEAKMQADPDEQSPFICFSWKLPIREVRRRLELGVAGYIDEDFSLKSVCTLHHCCWSLIWYHCIQRS